MSGLAEAVAVDGYRFTPDDLDPAARRPGISAFMRIKNGADFLEATIRSHIPHVDEIVAVYNQCTDATPDVLARLAREFGPERLRVFHYLPAVFPPGSEGHRSEPADSPRSLVTYYNFALTRTRFSLATKLDDDHLAIEEALAGLTARLRSGHYGAKSMACFSGLNLARDSRGTLGILAREPFSGGGDIGFFPVSRDTYFAHDPRFERFHRGGLRRIFGGIVYWHLKYLKPGFGFLNYGIEAGTNRRYARKRDAHIADRRVVDIASLPALAVGAERLRAVALRLRLPMPEKTRLASERWAAAMRMASTSPLAATVRSSTPAAHLVNLGGDA